MNRIVVSNRQITVWNGRLDMSEGDMNPYLSIGEYN